MGLMNVSQLEDITWKVQDDHHNGVSVYTTDDSGNLVPVMDHHVAIMRDGGEETPVLVLSRG